MCASRQVDRERSRFNFASTVAKSFAFLGTLGFERIESLPTIVRYRKDDLKVNVYHGRQSYEIGFEVVCHGILYSISQFIRATDAEAAERYRNYAATTPQGVVEGVARLAGLVKRYGERALSGEPGFFAMLENQRKAWGQRYALDVLAGNLRPKANDAFRSGDYRLAAELYEKIRERLSPAELKKLTLAKERAEP